MLWISFLLTNLHFAVYLLGLITTLIMSFVLFTTFRNSKEKKVFIRMLGFLLLGVYFAVHTWQDTGFKGDASVIIFKLLGIALITASFYIDPVINIPSAIVVPFMGNLTSLFPILRVVSFAGILALTGRIYLKYSKGLEREFKNLYRGFLILIIAEGFSLVEIFKESSNVFLANLAADYSFTWIASHVFMIAAFIFLLVYAWGYLRFQLFTQIFGAFVITSLALFIFIAAVYTFLLVHQMQSSAEGNLKTNLATFNYSIGRIREQGMAVAKVIARDDNIRSLLLDEEKLGPVLSAEMITSGVDFLAVLDTDGRVMARGEGYGSSGVSMSDNFVVAKALKGQGTTNIMVREWVNAPLVIIEVGFPIDGGRAVYTGYILDSAFVDGFKEASGLETSIYAGDVKSATTFVAPDGVSRLVGAKQTSKAITSQVLGTGKEFLGLSRVFSTEYISAYGPFNSEEGKVLGMFFVGIPSSVVFDAARASLSTTFYITILLAIASFIPAYLFARFIEKNQV